jgi:hypothetical protein
MNNKLLIVAIITYFMILVCSCRKETTYNLTLINETNYQIDKIEFSCAVDDKSVSVPSFGSSKKFELRYEKEVCGNCFSEPLLCISVTAYSDSTQIYQNEIGSTMSMSDLKKNNEFIIRHEPNSLNPTDIFTVTRR